MQPRKGESSSSSCWWSLYVVTSAPGSDDGKRHHRRPHRPILVGDRANAYWVIDERQRASPGPSLPRWSARQCSGSAPAAAGATRDDGGTHQERTSTASSAHCGRPGARPSAPPALCLWASRHAFRRPLGRGPAHSISSCQGYLDSGSSRRSADKPPWAMSRRTPRHQSEPRAARRCHVARLLGGRALGEQQRLRQGFGDVSAVPSAGSECGPVM